MATSYSLKMALAQSLATYLQTAIPSLTCVAGFADPEQKMQHPSLQIIPHKMTFNPFVDQVIAGDDDTLDEVVTGSSTDMLLDLGEFEGPMELRLVARHQPQREKYQSAILDALMAGEDTPGVTPLTMSAVQFFTTAGDVITNYAATGAVFLENEDWLEEMAWDKHRFTYLQVTGQFPMLVLRRAIPNIEQLIVQLTENLAEDVNDIPSEQIEQVQVNDDGSLSSV